MNPKLPAPSYRKEDKIEIHGRITKEFFNLPLADIKVTLTVLNGFNELYTTRSALNGDFKFSGLDYQDTVFLKIEAARASGRKNLLIYVFTRDELRDPKAVYYTNQVLKKPGEAGRMYVEEEPEKDPFEEQNNDVFRLHQVPNDVIIVDDNMKHYQNIAQILQGRVPGVLVTGNSVTIRGINSIYGNTEPLYLVDGMIVDQGYALSLSPSDVERIEILKGPETAIYGSRGANGVIAIYTQRGKFMIKGVLEMDVLGYYTPKEFYNPRYELLKEDPVENDRRTLYWAPEIVTGSEGLVEISFPTSDITGLYRIHIQGLTTDGKPIGGSAFFEVK
jgi:TonB-dependent SusC/RagA subfamily outer membrane receptor